MKSLVLVLILLAPIPAHALVTVGFHWHAHLAPHGRWVWLPEVGEVWVPAVEASWQPYLHGHWVWSPWGWLWVSHDPWGHLTDHYGRWVWTTRWGWVWVPGRVWAPAWVVWISGPGWIGWAPAPPPWRGPWGRPDYYRHDRCWVVVHERGFFSPSLAEHRVPDSKVRADVMPAVERRVKRGLTFSAVPDRVALERRTGQAAPVMKEALWRQGPLDPKDLPCQRAEEPSSPAPYRERFEGGVRLPDAPTDFPHHPSPPRASERPRGHEADRDGRAPVEEVRQRPVREGPQGGSGGRVDAPRREAVREGHRVRSRKDATFGSDQAMARPRGASAGTRGRS